MARRGASCACCATNSPPAPPPYNLPMPRRRPSRAICARLIEAPNGPTTREDLAARHGLTARTLARHFRRHLGMNFGEWCRRAAHAARAGLVRGRPPVWPPLRSISATPGLVGLLRHGQARDRHARRRISGGRRERHRHRSRRRQRQPHGRRRQGAAAAARQADGRMGARALRAAGRPRSSSTPTRTCRLYAKYGHRVVPDADRRLRRARSPACTPGSTPRSIRSWSPCRATRRFCRRDLVDRLSEPPSNDNDLAVAKTGDAGRIPCSR